VHRRYQIAVLVYFSVEIIGATQLYYPLPLMIISAFFVGLIAVTSFNIRMSATQSYIPNDKRARINSAQNLMHGLGSIIGLLVIGYLATYVTNDYRLLVLGSAVVSLGAILLFPVRLKKEFIKIYNREV
jgi:MFS family permease